jgi:hypothetical protein
MLGRLARSAPPKAPPGRWPQRPRRGHVNPMVGMIPLVFEALTFAGILYGVVGAILFGVTGIARSHCIVMAGAGAVLLLAGSIIPTGIDFLAAGALYAALSAGVGWNAVREAKPLVFSWSPARMRASRQMAAETEDDWATWSSFANKAPTEASRARERAPKR